jgi:hypothetical protein
VPFPMRKSPLPRIGETVGRQFLQIRFLLYDFTISQTSMLGRVRSFRSAVTNKSARGTQSSITLIKVVDRSMVREHQHPSRFLKRTKKSVQRELLSTLCSLESPDKSHPVGFFNLAPSARRMVRLLSCEGRGPAYSDNEIPLASVKPAR